MDVITQELSESIPDLAVVVRSLLRLSVAFLVGCVLGWEREAAQKAAGLRTHVLVSMGAAVFALIGTSAHATSVELGHVIHGVAAGIGFIGTGTILKRHESEQIQGLTTAASIWMTAAVGLAAGAGMNAAAFVGALGGFLVLRIFAGFSLVPDRQSSST